MQRGPRRDLALLLGSHSRPAELPPCSTVTGLTIRCPVYRGAGTIPLRAIVAPSAYGGTRKYRLLGSRLCNQPGRSPSVFLASFG